MLSDWIDCLACNKKIPPDREPQICGECIYYKRFRNIKKKKSEPEIDLSLTTDNKKSDRKVGAGLIIRSCQRPNCHNNFEVKFFNGRPGRARFCSIECSSSSRALKVKTTAVCKYCEIHFPYTYGTVYCSTDCKEKGRLERSKRKPKNCPICNSLIEAKFSNRIYCCHNCSSIGRLRREMARKGINFEIPRS